MRIDRTDELKWELMDVITRRGFVLCRLYWNPDKPEKRIRWNSIGAGLEMFVYGLPLDYPLDRLKKDIDKALSTSNRDMMIDTHLKHYKGPVSWWLKSKKKEESA